MSNKIMIDPLSGDVVISFQLPAAATVSAGLYTPEDVLITTIFSGKKYPKGQNTYSWDKKDILGIEVAPGSYKIIISNNTIQAEWEGVLGNTSTRKSGTGKHAGYQFIADVCIWGGNLFYCNEYWEQRPKQYRVGLASPGVVATAIPGYYSSPDSRRVCTDGTKVYWSGRGMVKDNVYLSFIFATLITDNSLFSFSAGTTVELAAFNNGTFSAVSLQKWAGSTADAHWVADIAVQPSGSYLFEAYPNSNQVKVFNKNTGAFVQAFTVAAPWRIACDKDNNLWAATASSIKKYTLSAGGSITTSGNAITGFTDIKDLCVSPDGTTLMVTDGGTAQQVKAYRTANSAALWSFGQPNGYKTNPAVKADKFSFGDNGSIAIQNDGSFWVIDGDNYRLQKYTAARAFADSIMYLPKNRAIAVDKTNPVRVFSGFLEFAVDYSKTLGQAGAWQLVNNWIFNAANYQNEFYYLTDVTTLANGRTYCMSYNTVTKNCEMLELVAATGLRPTGLYFPTETQLYPDGLYFINNASSVPGDKVMWYKRPVTGFDKNNNPVFGPQQTLATIIKTATDPVYSTVGWTASLGEIIEDLLISFDGTNGEYVFQSKGYHLGAIQMGSSKWKWKTAYETGRNYNGDFPEDERFENGNGTNYPGSRARVAGDIVIMGHHGEFWKGGQTNEYKMYYKNGLYLGGFGTNVQETRQLADPSFPPKMAGNGFANCAVRKGNAAWLYHGDEGWHSGVHRWKITGLETIALITLPVMLSANWSAARLHGRETSLMNDLPLTSATLINGSSGWERSPAEDYDTGYPHVLKLKTGYADYKQKNIGFLFVGVPKDAVWFRKPIHINHLDSWRMGFDYVNYMNPNRCNNEGNNEGGAYYEILDDAGKTIARMEYRFDGPIRFFKSVLVFNGINVFFPPENKGMDSFHPVDISFADSRLRFIFGGQPPVYAPVAEAGANPHNIGFFRVRIEQVSDYKTFFSAAIRNLMLYADNENSK